MTICSRRDFVAGAVAAAGSAALPIWSVAESKGTGVPAHGWQYESAGSAARAIRNKQVS